MMNSFLEGSVDVVCSFDEVQIDFESLKNSEKESEFMSAAVSLSNELYPNLILLTGIRESNILLNQKEAIISALLLRIAKLFNSFMDLAVNHDSIGTSFLYRGITDCIIDMEILIKRNDDNLFDEFVRHSLYAELEKIVTLEKKIENRAPLPIEQRMLIGIEKDIEQSGYSIDDVRRFPHKRNNKWKNLNSREKITELGCEDMYLFGQNAGNNFIHSNWSTLLYQHLEYHDGGKFSLKYDNHQIRPQLLLAIQQLICIGAQKYISYMFSSEEIKEQLSDVFSQTFEKIIKVDELHETFIVKKQYTKE